MQRLWTASGKYSNTKANQPIIEAKPTVSNLSRLTTKLLNSPTWFPQHYCVLAVDTLVLPTYNKHKQTLPLGSGIGTWDMGYQCRGWKKNLSGKNRYEAPCSRTNECPFLKAPDLLLRLTPQQFVQADAWQAEEQSPAPTCIAEIGPDYRKAYACSQYACRFACCC